ncbi:3801_t:CDS:2 [Acaulospora morrowiae]|uniref:3801_t:CDS:1 n=1 Tax=Acaulospora morrowiae TaxID=94023 RepID=A0A9N8VR18_9GLOM|nr:3801_t:CDS:2 [Acaulospora morrowiae]
MSKKTEYKRKNPMKWKINKRVKSQVEPLVNKNDEINFEIACNVGYK